MASPSLLNCGIDLRIHSDVIMYLYFALFIPGLLLNLMAAWISWRLKVKSSFVVYLKNLVGADLLMSIIIPLKAAEKLPGSPRGLRGFNCQFGSVLFYLCMYVSIVLMGIISLDRFFKIVRPGGRQLRQSALFGQLVSTFVWVGLLSIATIPTMALTNQEPKTNDSAEFCMAMKTELGKVYHSAIVHFSNVTHVVVLIIIAVCYTCIAMKVIESHRSSGSTNTKGKRRVTARVFSVLVVYLVCFTPYHIARIFYDPEQVKNMYTCQWASRKVAKDVTLWLATTNICLDPLIYFLLCKAFREKLYELKIFARCISTSPQENTEDASL